MALSEAQVAAQYAAQYAPIQAAMQAAEATHKRQTDVATQNRDRNLSDAYQIYQKELNTMPQELRAMGSHGGMTGTNRVRLANDYQNMRQGAEQDYTNTVADLDLSLNNELGGYRGQMAALQQAEAAAKQAAAQEAAYAAARASSGSGASSGEDYSRFVGWFNGTKSTNLTIKNLVDYYGNNYAAISTAMGALGLTSADLQKYNNWLSSNGAGNKGWLSLT